MGSSLKAQSNHSKTKFWLRSPPTGSNSPNQSLVPILVCPGRHNKIPHTEQLKQQAIFKQTKKKKKPIFPTLLEARTPWSRRERIQFLVQVLFLAFRQLPPCSGLTWPFLSTCAWRKKESETSGITMLRTLNLLGQGSTLMASYNFHYFLTGPDLQIQWLGRVRASTCEWGEGRHINI